MNPLMERKPRIQHKRKTLIDGVEIATPKRDWIADVITAHDTYIYIYFALPKTLMKKNTTW